MAYRRDARMICQHQATHFVTGIDIGRLTHWRYLDRSGTPWNEVRQIPVAYAKKGLIDLIGKSQWGSEAVAVVGTYINRFDVTHNYIQI